MRTARAAPAKVTVDSEVAVRLEWHDGGGMHRCVGEKKRAPAQPAVRANAIPAGEEQTPAVDGNAAIAAHVRA